MPSSQPPGGPSPQGLTSAQVRQRVQAGQVNTPPDSPTKSVRRIVFENLFSFFNLIFYVIAGFLIAVGSFEELVFLLVVGANTAIGIIQELHSKKKLDELSLLSAPKATVIRNGTEQTIPTAQLVQDDRILLPQATKFPPTPKWSPAPFRSMNPSSPENRTRSPKGRGVHCSPAASWFPAVVRPS